MSPSANTTDRSLEPGSIDWVVYGRVQREVRRLGHDIDVAPAVTEAIRAGLYAAEATDEEREVHALLRGSTMTDALGAVLSLRLGHALRLGFGAACEELGVTARIEPSAVLVLRRDVLKEQKVDSQVSGAVARVKERLGRESGAGEDSSSLFVLAHEKAFDRLRRWLPSGDGSRVVFYTRQDTTELGGSGSTDDVEIVEVDLELYPLERHLRSLFQAAEPAAGAGAIDAEPEDHAEDGDDDALIGTLFHDKYRIVSKIGVGGFGAVYEATDERGAGNRVAIKVLKGDLAQNQALVTSFRNEARRVTRLSHPNIVDWKVFDATPDGTHYFVMELVEGEELDKLLAREGPLEPERAANILHQMLDALRAAHHVGESESILHLDLKPRNVFICPPRRGRSEQVKVIDFGIGQYVGEEDIDEDLPDLEAHTPTRVVPGEGTFNPTTIRFAQPEEVRPNKGTPFKRSTGCTPEYASPEQCAHVLGLSTMVPLDGRSDLYSLGVMAFQMLTGRLPFTRPLVRTDFLQLHLRQSPRKTGATGAKVPRRLARFVDRCLVKDRDERWRDTQEAFEALDRIVRPPVGRRVAMVVAPVVLAAFVVGFLLSRGEKPSAALTALGHELNGAQPLVLGPERASVELSTLADGAFDDASDLALVRALDRTPLQGWSVTWSAPGTVTVTAPDVPPSGRIEERVVLQADDEPVLFEDFPLVWIGPEAWSIASVRGAGVELAELGGRAVDPRDLVLRVAVDGEAFGDVERALARCGDHEVETPNWTVSGGQRVFEIALDEFPLADGPAELLVSAVDSAGRVEPRSFAFRVETGSIAELRAKEIRDTSDGPVETAAVCNRLGDRYAITDHTRPTVFVALPRTADLTWWWEDEGQPGVRHREASLTGRDAYALDVDFLKTQRTGGLLGTVYFELDDTPYVLRAEARRRPVRDGVRFEVMAGRADFRVQLSDGSEWREGRPVYTAARELEVDVWRARFEGPVRVELGWRDAAGETQGRVADLRAGREGQRLEFVLPSDGRHEVVVRAYSYSSTGRSLAEQPDVERRFEVIVDTEPPILELAGLAAQEIVRGPFAAEPTIVVQNGEIRPVDAHWQLIDREGRTRHTGEAVEASGEPVGLPLTGLWGKDAPLPDGDYVLRLQAEDEAGNVAELERAFTVARSGPTVRVEQPAAGGEWFGAGGVWSVQLRVADPNDVETVACEVEAAGEEPRPVALVREGDVWKGVVDFPHTWSEKPVRLRVRAADRHGATRDALEPDEYRLPRIAPPRPEAVALADGSGCVMRLVEGNGSRFLFGGQGELVELDLYVRAGLARPGESFRIPYEPGEIADFYLDEYEVSVGEYLAFVRAPQGYADASNWPRGAADPEAERQAALQDRLSLVAPDLPVSDVSWEEAFAYARWYGKRLPSWVEMEYAMRGGSKAYRPYACYRTGGELADGVANVKGRNGGRDGPWVRGTGADATPDTGIHDLTGNVREWTSTPVVFGAGTRVEGDPARYLEAHRLESLGPHADVTREWERSGAFWFVGGCFYRDYFDFKSVRNKPRGWSSTRVGFRCALSIDEVRKGLERGTLREDR